MPFLSSSLNSSASIKFLTRFSVPYKRAAFLSVFCWLSEISTRPLVIT